LNSVTYDGKLTICCQDQFEKINLGNAFETPLIELVSTPAYAEAIRKARNMEYDFCEECN
jgi:radical SAM protein with 4Fe4S-binding SPASM domain